MQLKEWNAHINLLEAKAESAGDDLKTRLKKAQAKLK